MKIAIIGPGAMGLLFAAYLTKDANNEVFMVGRNKDNMDLINKDGIIVKEIDGSVGVYRPYATTNCTSVGVVDLVVNLVKANDSKKALDSHKCLIGENTILMSLQNGAGHENLLKEYTDIKNVAVGNTLDGCCVIKPNEIIHTGIGKTAFGMIKSSNDRLQDYVKTFNECGFDTESMDNINYIIWKKLLINASSSALAGVLDMPQGYCADDSYAFEIVRRLITEACDVARKDNIIFDTEEEIARIKKHLEAGRNGIVSIIADLNAGRFTEVDTISGSVLKRGLELGVPTPTHAFIIELVHAMERRKEYKI